MANTLATQYICPATFTFIEFVNQFFYPVKPILEVIDVRKAYASHVALDGVSLVIPEGSIFGLLGPNGAGKTSLIRIITQITGADEGEIRFRGERLNP